jgi:hypothetical protein
MITDNLHWFGAGAACLAGFSVNIHGRDQLCPGVIGSKTSRTALRPDCRRRTIRIDDHGRAVFIQPTSRAMEVRLLRRSFRRREESIHSKDGESQNGNKRHTHQEGVRNGLQIDLVHSLPPQARRQSGKLSLLNGIKLAGYLKPTLIRHPVTLNTYLV